MKTTINNVTTNILSKKDLNHASTLLTKWQQEPLFMQFLKENSMNDQENFDNLNKIFHEPMSQCMSIHINNVSEIVGIIVFKNFNSDIKQLEISSRISPELRGCGIGTEAKKLAIANIFSLPEVNSIVSRHSAWNQGSFNTNKRNGFKLVDFVANQTFLPNLNKITDDFKWELHKNQNKDTTSYISDQITTLTKARILQGLDLHGLSCL